MIKEYKVLNARHLRTLEALVNLNVRKGWQPHGSVFALKTQTNTTMILALSDCGKELVERIEAESDTNWFQAMILEDQES